MKCKHCASENTIEIELVEDIGYHIGDTNYHGDTFWLCKDCGRITVIEKKNEDP